MLNHLKNATNYTTTENGALTHTTTFSGLLDFFAMGGAMRSRNEDDIIRLFMKAYAEDAHKAMKLLFYIRDVRGGQGERRTFRTILHHLATGSTKTKTLVSNNLHNIAEYGRYDDLLTLIGTPLEKETIALIKEQMWEDLKTEYPSLLAKWLPSENASSRTTKQLATKISSALGLTPRQYRKTLSTLRGRINVIETLMSENRWDEIDYSKIPSKAGLQYRQAFYRHDAERYSEFMMPAIQEESVVVNAGTLYPYEIVQKAIQTRYVYLPNKELEFAVLDNYWKSLPDYVGEDQSDTLVMVDVSGSMTGIPMDVAISLGIYFAERNKGEYQNHFMTFSSNPKIVKLEGENIVEKVLNMREADWGYNTNFTKALHLILATAVTKNLGQSELPSKLLVVSDMEFDAAGGDETIVERYRKLFANAGYEMPDLVFWNVDARQENIPAFNGNVTLVSGFSPSIFQQVIENKSALELMNAVIDSSRYDAVKGLA